MAAYPRIWLWDGDLRGDLLGFDAVGEPIVGAADSQLLISGTACVGDGSVL